MPPTAAQIAIALGRSGPTNTSVMIDNVDGMIIAPPTPMRALAAMTWPALSAKMAPNAAALKSTSPRRSIIARPCRSPRLPIVSSRPAKTRM